MTDLDLDWSPVEALHQKVNVRSLLHYLSISSLILLIQACDSDVEGLTQSRPNPPPKRRRVLKASDIIPVPIYSNKVQY